MTLAEKEKKSGEILFIIVFITAFFISGVLMYYFVYPLVSTISFVFMMLGLFFVFLLLLNIILYLFLGKPQKGIEKGKSAIGLIISAFATLLGFSVVIFAMISYPSLEAGKMSITQSLPIVFGIIGMAMIIIGIILKYGTPQRITQK